MASSIIETRGVRVAIEGCGHGTLNAIYATVAESCKARGWDTIDILIIGGDFQAVRNAADLSIMSCPVKYRQLGDFPDYYAGTRKAPYLTIFVGGNHEASSHLWELYYGGWVAPNIYYMGASNVLRFGPLRIAGMSGIWKGFDYRKPHHERLPFSADDVKSFYHVREVDVRKLLLLQSQVDVGISHDWPRYIEQHGDSEWLFRKKPDFRWESQNGHLGSIAAEHVMDRLRPLYWFSAHMHIKFAAVKKYGMAAVEHCEAADKSHLITAPGSNSLESSADTSEKKGTAEIGKETNPDEIDLDMDDDDGEDLGTTPKGEPRWDSNTKSIEPNETNEVSDTLRAQLPASFAPPKPRLNGTPGQPIPPGITNKEVRFLALDKCLPGRHFLQTCEIKPFDSTCQLEYASTKSNPRYALQYDPEWLAITRVFHDSLSFGDKSAQTSRDLGEAHYVPLIKAERAWVEENIVEKDKLDVPENFEVTAAPHVHGTPEIVPEQPEEHTNPQTVAFCKLLGLKNLWDASAEERQERRNRGPPPSENTGQRGGFGRGRGGRGRGGGWGRGKGGRGRGGGHRGRW
ncbi:lariat debranching enzyme [Conoideocrella luteorostrata]|uniref:Lariat debranching enzyme n=1 Tax=Conoideocrella luteorostrata TaxID=1105319 RepID=A0AAJ0FUQ5_9HYPO|nr:lariat debranching enzyme [Conoideocrella luteorostrata]